MHLTFDSSHPLLDRWLKEGHELSPQVKSHLERLSPEHISGIPLSQLDSPMMKQYRQAKESIPDALLFFRMGDFFELFGLDAIIVSDICELALTSRDRNSENPVAMAGVPVVAHRNALKKCLERGFKVAVCDQVEDAKFAKGIVKREVIRVATPAVPGDLDDDEVSLTHPSHQPENHCYLGTVFWDSADKATWSYVDVATGEFRLTSGLSKTLLEQELATLKPKEVLVAPHHKQKAEQLASLVAKEGMSAFVVSSVEPWVLRSQEYARTLFCEFFQGGDLNRFGVSGTPFGLEAVSALLSYLKSTQKEVLRNIKHIQLYELGDSLMMDEATRKHLEFFVTSTGERKGSLFHFINRTMTSPGSRLLARRLNYPFRHEAPIQQSHGFVNELVAHGELREVFEHALGRVADLERLLSRAAQRGLDIRHLMWLRESLHVVTTLKGQVMPFAQKAPLLLEKIVTQDPSDVLRSLLETLNRALVDDPQPPEKGSVVFRTGYSPEWDECVSLETSLDAKLSELEAFERERSQIQNLKIGYTRVFGYYFEISKGKLSQVPEHFTRKQTLSTGERFITPELKELEEKALAASDNRASLERTLLENLRQDVLNASEGLVSAAHLTAELDVILCFAKLANDHGWARPTLLPFSATKLLGSVHPVLAANNKGSGPMGFVENDIILKKEQPLHLVTGPNMAGKSTLMRQVVLAQVLCQMGSFVPAKQAELGLCDRVLTRIGSGDHQLRGQSTFMVEMMETAHILRMATSKSLMIFDEIGRGTSTFDGLSLAWSILEYLHDHIGARTLFSTHYHELCEICPTRPKIVSMHMAVGEENTVAPDGQELRHILFTHKYKPGSAGRSYGIHVAELAGIPRTIIERAQEVLERLEHGEPKKRARARGKKDEGPTLWD